MLLRRLRRANLTRLVEFEPGQQTPGALWRPLVDQRSLNGQGLDRNALARVVRDGLVGREIVDVVAGRPVEFSHRRRQQIARSHERGHLHGPRRVVQEVERPDQVVERCHGSLLDALVEGQHHRRLRLVRLGVHGDAVAAGIRHRVTLRLGVQHVRRAGVVEHHHPVVDLLRDAAAKDLRRVHEVHVAGPGVLDVTPCRLRSGTHGKGRVQGLVRGIEIAAHVQRGDALLDRHRVETAGVGLRRQVLDEIQPLGFVEPEEITDGVGVFESGEAPERRALAVPSGNIRFEQRFLHRRQDRGQLIRFGHQRADGRHLAVLEAFVDPCPSPEGGGIREVVSKPRQIKRCQDRAGVARDAVLLNERCDLGFECVDRSGQRQRDERGSHADRHRFRHPSRAHRRPPLQPGLGVQHPDPQECHQPGRKANFSAFVMSCVSRRGHFVAPMAIALPNRATATPRLHPSRPTRRYAARQGPAAGSVPDVYRRTAAGHRARLRFGHR